MQKYRDPQYNIEEKYLDHITDPLQLHSLPGLNPPVPFDYDKSLEYVIFFKTNALSLIHI